MASLEGDIHAQLSKLIASGEFAGMAELSLVKVGFSIEVVELFHRAPPGPLKLHIFEPRNLDGPAWQRLLDSPALSRLQSLSLACKELPHEALESAYRMRGLDVLRLYQCTLAEPPTAPLPSASAPVRLEIEGGLDEHAVECLFAKLDTSRLEELVLKRVSLQDRAIRILAGRSAKLELPRLRLLDLSENLIGDELAVHFTVYLPPMLEVLLLQNNDLHEPSLERLARSEVVPQLEALGLSGNPVYDPERTVQDWPVGAPEPIGEIRRLMSADRMKQLFNFPAALRVV